MGTFLLGVGYDLVRLLVRGGTFRLESYLKQSTIQPGVSSRVPAFLNTIQSKYYLSRDIHFWVFLATGYFHLGVGSSHSTIIEYSLLKASTFKGLAELNDP